MIKGTLDGSSLAALHSRINEHQGGNLTEHSLKISRQNNAIRCNSHETSFGTILTVIYLFLSKSQINGGKTVWCNERMFAILREKFRQNTKVTSTVSYGFTAPLYALDFSFISLFTYISIS